MKFNHKKRSGMLVLSLAAGLTFIMIVFISLLNRMRAESYITNRVSINERLNQAACAIGRLAIRKLQKDIEMRDPEVGQLVIDQMLSGKTGKLNTDGDIEKKFTAVINRMEVISTIKDKFKKQWGEKGEITTFKVQYEVDVGKAPAFSAPIAGVKENKYERKGFIDMIITLGIKAGVTRKYKVRKEFIFSRLLAPPFYRFTLFSPNGANIKDDLANSLTFKDSGELLAGKRPLICLNRLNDMDPEDNRNPMNFVKNAQITATDFEKNGWIYLGGDGQSQDSNKKNGKLILNVVPGCDDDNMKKKFGEFFHFYFNPSSSGWLMIDNWSSWLGNKIDSSKGDGESTKMTFVNYGLYKGLLDIEFAPSTMTGYYLFKDKVAENYRETTGMPGNLDKGSALHLFGTPKHCTPTLIFGPVQRRYLRCFALYYSKLSRVFPLRAVTDWKTSSRSLEALYKNEIFSWYVLSKQNSGGYDAASVYAQEVSDAFSENLSGDSYSGDAFYDYYNGFSSSNLCGIGPRIIDTEPYIKALQNISKPLNPEYEWKQSVKVNCLNIDKPEDICKSDYTFSNDSESLYKGNLEEIRIDYDTYLRDRTTYTLKAENKTPISVKNNAFIQKHFFTDNKKRDFNLDQIIRIDGDLHIDQELNVSKGGIIVCTGKVTISAPIKNKHHKSEGGWLSSLFSQEDPDSFGYLTIVAQKGIDIKSTAAIKGDPLPKIEGFFIAGCAGNNNANVTVDTGIHFVGGVASDNIESLVKNGCIVEWGFTPGECTKLDVKDFYGLTLGPRDIEIYSGE